MFASVPLQLTPTYTYASRINILSGTNTDGMSSVLQHLPHSGMNYSEKQSQDVLLLNVLLLYFKNERKTE
jgi:hypothetical protein